MMRRFINLLESSVMDVHGEEIDSTPLDFDLATELEREFQKFDQDMRMRRQVEDVYLLVLDGIPFEDAVGHIAKRAGIEPLDLRVACVDDYKVLRSKGETYDYAAGHALVNALNPIIREAIEASLSK